MGIGTKDRVVAMKIAFLNAIKEFEGVHFDKEIEKTPARTSVFVGNRKKRWMQIDVGSKRLSIAMDHAIGDFSFEDIEELEKALEQNNVKDSVKLKLDGDKWDAVNVAFFENQPFDFEQLVFRDFLEKHYRSHKKISRNY